MRNEPAEDSLSVKLIFRNKSSGGDKVIEMQLENR